MAFVCQLLPLASGVIIPLGKQNMANFVELSVQVAEDEEAIITEESTFDEINAVVEAQIERLSVPPSAVGLVEAVTAAAEDKGELLGVLGPLGAVMAAGAAAYALLSKKRDEVRHV